MNKLNVEKKAAAVGMLCEGSSIRSVERITGIHRDTVMRLGVRIGEGCRQIMDEKMRNLPCRFLELDEVLGVCRNEAENRIARPQKARSWRCVDVGCPRFRNEAGPYFRSGRPLWIYGRHFH